ncbi:hypothetical protein GF406_12635 [candidate division KSB1 bacterium]|nr:hypothetical protein [candidate division KSB1 bacterium]
MIRKKRILGVELLSSTIIFLYILVFADRFFAKEGFVFIVNLAIALQYFSNRRGKTIPLRWNDILSIVCGLLYLFVLIRASQIIDVDMIFHVLFDRLFASGVWLFFVFLSLIRYLDGSIYPKGQALDRDPKNQPK